MYSTLLDQPHTFNSAAPDAVLIAPYSVRASLAFQLLPDQTAANQPAAAAAIHEAYLPALLITRLRNLRRDDMDILPTLLLTAFTVFLSRYTNQQTVQLDLALPIHQATDLVIPKLPLGSMPIDLDLADTPPFTSVLRHMHTYLTDAIEQRVDAAARLPLPQDTSSITFVYHTQPQNSSQAYADSHPGLELDLRLEITDTAHGVRAAWVYQAGRFDAATIARMHGYFLTFLFGIAAKPAQSISRLPLLTVLEQRQLLVDWNATAAPYPDTHCIQALVEEQVLRQPDAPALTFEGTTLSYHELNTRANQLAHYLQGLGVGPETLVGICVDRSLEMVVGVLGVLKAGGAYVPLDPTYPAERLNYMIADAQMPVLLVQQPAGVHNSVLEDAARGHALSIVDLNSDWARIAEQPDTNPRSDTTADNLAYVIYTSGSTGAPKGVLLQHRGLVNLVLGQIQAFELTPESRVLQFASFSFDASVSEIFITLIAGARLYLAPRSTLVSPPELLGLLRAQAITTVTLPPALLAILPTENLPALRTVISAGESCSWEIARRWMPNRRFINAYGPTETTVGPTYYLAEGALPGTQTVPIGRPLPNIQLYILDQHRHPVPIGVPGELYIGGIALARGYLNRLELTAERFITWTGTDATTSTDHTARLYKTGDLVRYLPDGNIEFLGRIDHQVKLRGFRIELGEIEATLRQHPAVQNAVVLAREDTPGDTRLVGYVTPKDVRPIELWPSVAEYFVYDEVLYHAMTNDERRNESYRVALRQVVPGKVALDIGTGRDAILARLAIEAGARKVYAIELLDESYRLAKATIERLGLTDRIILIHGDAQQVELPEPIDVCVSEIVGAIGGSEGASRIINDAWRFMKPGGTMIPARSTTRIAAISLPDDLLGEPAFTPMSGHYVKQIFEQRGYKFDLRLCLRNMRRDDLRSTIGVLEDLDFSGISDPEYDRAETLTITSDGRVDGFLVWLNLYTTSAEVIDILDHEHCWIPVFLPVFPSGVQVHTGDRIEMLISSRLCDNGLNPDYMLRGQLIRQDGTAIPFEHSSYHYKPVYRQSPFYQRLFADDQIPVRTTRAATIDSQELRSYLQRHLPTYMVPSALVRLKELPLSLNGKLDRRALPPPEADDTARKVSAAPRTPEEIILVDIWAKVLNYTDIGIHDDFFALGGHSLLAAQAISLINATLNRDIPLRVLYEAPTVAAFVYAIHPETSALAPITPAYLAAEVMLDASITPPAATRRPCDAPVEAIFLTGATGFLGSFLLYELLAQTSATLYCLVRAANIQEAGRRIEQTLATYQIWRDDWRSRIVPVVGDLREPRLGLSTQTFQHLADTVDVIYHAGAQVHYLHPYDTLKAANVQGMVEVLRLACQDHLKPVHYVSTLAVAANGDSAYVREDDDLADCTSEMGYIQSKWVAEGIIRLARARGLQVAIYRPGRISGHSQTGAANLDDFFMRLLAGCIQLGLAPDVPMTENLIPVDYTAQAIVHLSQQPALASETLHLLNPQQTQWQWVVEVAQDLGYPLRMALYQEWHHALVQGALSERSQVLHSLLLLMQENQADNQVDDWAKQIFDTQKAAAGLAGSGISCQTIDTALLERILSDSVRRGLFAAPASQRNAEAELAAAITG